MYPSSKVYSDVTAEEFERCFQVRALGIRYLDSRPATLGSCSAEPVDLAPARCQAGRISSRQELTQGIMSSAPICSNTTPSFTVVTRIDVEDTWMSFDHGDFGPGSVLIS